MTWIRRRGAGIAKRSIDTLAGGMALIVLAPLLAAVALAVRMTLGPPVLFRQLRPGLRGRPFVLLKFRTMHETSDGEGSHDDEARLSQLGRFLRSWSLDELPALVNVLRGEMSLVGPRPLLMKYVPLYSAEQFRRHEVKPGLTGWAQVHGRNAVSWEQRFELDVWYVDHWSLGLDLRILARTVWTVLSRHGVSQEGRATMEEFRGSWRS